jgi:hypothetical protein
MSTELVVLRPVVAGDLNYIYRNWLADLRAEDQGALPDDLWYPAHREAITRILADSAVVAVAAVLPDDVNEILGFAVAQPGEVLHWVHLRREFRGRKSGLVGRMLAAVGATPGTPAAWRMRSGRALQNPPRPRSVRGKYAATPSPTTSRSR